MVGMFVKSLKETQELMSKNSLIIHSLRTLNNNPNQIKN